MNLACFLTPFDFLGLSILDVIFARVGFPLVREVRHAT
jgi:hypothetical protein